MAANWSASFGYGFQIDDKALSDASTHNPFLDDLSSCIGERYPLLSIGYGGDAYTGRDKEDWVFIKDSVVKLTDDHKTFTLEGLQETLNSESLDQLYAFIADTGIVIGKPQWRMLYAIG